MKELLKKYWKPALIGLILLLTMHFVRDCQVDQIMNKSLKKDLEYQQKQDDLYKKLEQEKTDHQKTRIEKAELRKEFEFLKATKPKVIIKFIKGDQVDTNKYYVLKEVFDKAQFHYEKYISELLTNHEAYIIADIKGEKETDSIIFTLQKKIFILKKENIELKKTRLKLYKKAKGWLFLGPYIGIDFIHNTFAGGLSLNIPLIKIK